MPGFTIHIAIAKEYARKHPKEIKNIDEFIEGSIAPDYIPIKHKNISKNETHYGIWGDWTRDDQKIYLDKFLKDAKVNLNIDYWNGYFLHLLADDYFERIYFRQEEKQAKSNNETFHSDYDCLNPEIIKKYQVEPMEKIKEYMHGTNDNPRYLKINKVIDFIEYISNINLDEQAELIRTKGIEKNI